MLLSVTGGGKKFSSVRRQPCNSEYKHAAEAACCFHKHVTHLAHVLECVIIMTFITTDNTAPASFCCRGQVGRQVVEQLSVEYVRDLAAFQAKELTDLFGAATGSN